MLTSTPTAEKGPGATLASYCSNLLFFLTFCNGFLEGVLSPARTLQSPVRKMRSPGQTTEITHFRRSLASCHNYGDSGVLWKPGVHVPEPGFQFPGLGPQSAKPNRDSPAPGGSQERLQCHAGLQGFGAEPS